MNAQNLIAVAFQCGVELTPAGDKIRYSGKIPDGLLDALRKHKQEVLNYLIEEEKLAYFADLYEWDLDDLMDWYKNDYADIARLDLSQLLNVVRFYLENYDLCRCTDKN